MKHRKVIQAEGERPIAYNEKLPLSKVYYPHGGIGSFLAFQKEENSQFFFCSCAKSAIENYIELRLSTNFNGGLDLDNTPLLKSGFFPLMVVENTPNNVVTEGKSIIEKLRFKNNICHECQGILPKYRYCHEMYGTKFEQNYGWYINKQYFEYGILPGNYKVIPEKCPKEVLELIQEEKTKKEEKERKKNELEKRMTKIREGMQYEEWCDSNFPDEWYEMRDKVSQLKSEISKGYRKLDKVVENEVRAKLDHYKVGERWTSETILYHLVDTEYPNLEVQKHARPNFLDGLELDIFIEKEDVGIEYQGVQHYEPVEHWGGEEGLKKRKKRDKKKKELCKKEGIELIYFRYDENLSEEIVQERLEPHIGQ